MATLQNFIDGEPTPAEGELEPVLNPATGEELARAVNSSAEDVDRAVRAARRAFAGWAQTTPAERARALLALAQIVEDNGDELARSEALNAGKPLAAVQSDEIPVVAAGNTVVLKPAETTPVTTVRLAELAAETLPAGVLNVVTGRGEPTGEA